MWVWFRGNHSFESKSSLDLLISEITAIDFMISTHHWIHMSVTQKENAFMAIMCHSVELLSFFIWISQLNATEIFSTKILQLYCKWYKIFTLFKWVFAMNLCVFKLKENDSILIAFYIKQKLFAYLKPYATVCRSLFVCKFNAPK